MRIAPHFIAAFLAVGCCFGLAFADDITTKDGKVFKNVSITKVDPDGIHLIYDGGIGKIPFGQLSPELQKKYGYNPLEAQAYSDQEAERESRSDASRINYDVTVANNKATPSSTAPPPAGGDRVATSTLTPDQRAAIQAEIDSLKSDVSFMQQEEAKQADGHVRMDARRISGGAYPEHIASDESRIQQLEAQLSGS